MPHDLMRCQIGSYAEAICIFMMAELRKSALINTYTKQQNQYRPAISWKKKIVLLCENVLFLQYW